MPKLPGLSDVVDLLNTQTQALLAVPDAVRAVVELAIDAQRVVRRLDSLLDDLEQPLRELAPGLEKLARTLEGDEIQSIVVGVNDTQKQVAAIAATTGRIMSVIDDVGTRMSSFPGAPLLSGRRRARPAAD
ncbi:MAG TPA: hypothetical protein VNQ77_07160 [Frankiaceae bacterium]|nr:hypothetical protein [Frankiaceae bacterium]